MRIIGYSILSNYSNKLTRAILFYKIIIEPVI
uniref:Uncharacterized protein n=1 Tax=Podoviridae sp. ctsNK10 TaxID=2826582 RepID=A0A8S5NM33_9CAUD|nr:MAG TPA: hypothetical protein [Podoviridae sp. ctsNK10]